MDKKTPYEILEDLSGEVVADSLDEFEVDTKMGFYKILKDEKVEAKNVEDPRAKVAEALTEKKMVADFDLNKFPLDENEDDTPEQKEHKEFLMSLFKIYFNRFY